MKIDAAVRWLTRVPCPGIRVCLLVVLLLVLPGAAFAADSSTSTEQWRRNHEAELKADAGWLTVAGLFWLKEGPNTFGSGPAADIVLPSGSAPPNAGVFDLQGGRIVLRAASGANIRHNGVPVTTTPLRTDKTGSPDIVTLGTRLSMYIIQRGERFGVRLKDRESTARREFRGLHWYPVDPVYRVQAKFVPYSPPKEIGVPNVLGLTDRMKSPGYFEFTMEGRQLRLDPVFEGPDLLVIIFRDLTTGKETYPGGRFLYLPLPKTGTAALDFNRAENPPCAFTPFATCPLPPKQNRLGVAIRAGEKKYHD